MPLFKNYRIYTWFELIFLIDKGSIYNVMSKYVPLLIEQKKIRLCYD